MVSSKSNPNNSREHTNRLILEKSPYLLQHAHNPVDWYPWGDEAFEKAQRENKPVFLSIGYSTCHWCHMMKRESFDDPEVARLMNEAFVSIKVDREERPDIDNMYMAICQMISSNCGWPLNIIMTPDRKPFFAGTYFPKDSHSGRIGMLELIPQIEELWLTRPEDVSNSANEIITALKEISRFPEGEGIGEDVIRAAYEQLAQSFDQEYGGFGNAPKFPIPHNLFFLLRYWKRKRDSGALRMTEKTLQFMRRGGIYDHIGFGFHRYSTDRRWFIPHFEKMLYDQALLAMAYTEAYQATQKDEYKRTAQEIFAYVLREMRSPEGGFYSAEDAESEGEEGRFYLWTIGEIRKILGKDADLAAKVFNIEETGNFTDEASGRITGANIPYLRKSLADLAHDLRISEHELRRDLESIRERMSTARDKRLQPRKDDKILTDWNGLMIAALAKGAQALDEATYSDSAGKAVKFILNKMRSTDGRLFHLYRDGQPAVPGNLDDYVFLIWGLIELYEAAFDVQYLQTALDLTENVMKHFWDDEGHGFYFTSGDSEIHLFRKKEIYDGAIPSGNAIQMLNLLRLGRMTANPELEKKAELTCRAFSARVRQSPASFTQLVVGVDFLLGPSYEVVIAGNPKVKGTNEMLRTLRSRFLPNKILLMNPEEQETPDITTLAEFVKDHRSIEGKATAYVCVNHTCKQPTTDPNEMIEMLQ